MSTTIKGITIEINGDTKKLNKALEDVNKESSSLQGELKQVNKLLKFDPKNTELLAQKQKLLTDSIGNTKAKLDTLKEAERQVQQQFKEGKIGEEQYRAIQREVIATEQKLKGLETQLSNTNNSWKDVSKNLQDAGGKMKDIGGKMSAGVTAPIVGGLAAITEGTRDLRMDMGKLEAAFTTSGFTAEQAKAIYTDFYGILGESDTAIEAVNHLAELTSSQEELNDWTTIATGVFAKFGDSLPIEGLTEAANETAKVGQVTGPLADALNWAGVSEDAFNESLAACNSEQERASLITETLNGLYGDAAQKYREVNSEVIANNEATAKLKDSLATLGATLEPIMTKLVEAFTGLVSKFNEMSPATQNIILIFAGLAAALGPVLLVLGSLVTVVGGVATAFGTTALTVIGVSAGIGVAIGAVIAIGVALYKNWDEIKAKTIEVWTAIGSWLSTTLESIKTFFSQTWTSISETTSSTWNSIKTFFVALWGSIANLITSSLNSISAFIDSAWITIKVATLSVWEAIKAGVEVLVTTFTAKINNLFNTMKDGLVLIHDGLKMYFQGVWELIKNIFLGAVLLIIDLVTGDFEGFKSDSIAIFNNLKDAFKQIWEGIKSIFIGVVTVIVDTVIASWEGFKQKTINLYNSIKEFIQTTWANIKDSTINLVNKLVSSIQTSWNNFKTNTLAVFNAIKTFMSETWNGIYSTVTSLVENIKNTVSSKFEQMKNAIAEKMEQARQKIVETWNQAQQFLSSIDLFEIGKNIIQGLINGIGGMAEGLWNKVKELANGIPEWARKVLDINSPSKVMQTIGQFTVDGLILGIADKQDAVKTAMSSVVSAVTSVASDMVAAGASLGQSFSQSLKDNISIPNRGGGGGTSRTNDTGNSSYGNYVSDYEDRVADRKYNDSGSWYTDYDKNGNVVGGGKTGTEDLDTTGSYNPNTPAKSSSSSSSSSKTSSSSNSSSSSSLGKTISSIGKTISNAISSITKKKYHDGGWVGDAFSGLQSLRFDEVPAILQKGEFVLSHKMLNGIASMTRGSDSSTYQQQATPKVENTYNMNFYSPKALDPYETSRMNRNALRELAMQI